MMRKPRTFRPTVGDVLEDRMVPSVFGLPGSLGTSRQIASVPQQDAQRVLQAFKAFQQAYNQDVRSVLLPVGTINPSANRPAFDRAVVKDLGTLNAAIGPAIANLPTASSLGATIEGELIGTDPNTLQGLLASIPTPTSMSFQTMQTFTRVAGVYINQSASVVAQQVRLAQVPANSISQQAVQQGLGQVQGAFRTFSQTYSRDVRTILLRPGTTDPSAHRSAFDQAVGAALLSLNMSIDTTLSNLPASLTATLKATLQDDLLGGGSTGNSLQSRLAALQTPTGATDSTARAFRFGSSLNISNAQAQVHRDIVIAVSQFNALGSGTTG